MCANIYVFIYFMISYGKDIAILYHYLTFSVNTRVRSPSVAGANSLHFLSVTRKKTEAKERVRNRPELGGRLSDFSSHSMGSLRSNSISYFVACLALQAKTQYGSENRTVSKDLLVRSVFEEAAQSLSPSAVPERLPSAVPELVEGKTAECSRRSCALAESDKRDL